ncbi:glycosyltransferase [Zobellella taiwanensis]
MKPYDLYKDITLYCDRKESDKALELFYTSNIKINTPMHRLCEVALSYYQQQYIRAYELLEEVPLTPQNPIAKKIRNYWFLKTHIKIEPLKEESEITKSWTKSKKVSVLCATYNQQEYVEECIKSILRQKTKYPFEIIIHDDASTDETACVIYRYKKKYPNIIKTIFQKENQYSQGVKPFKLLLEESIGDFICYCEGDDYWLSEYKLEQQASLLDNSNTFLCFHDFIKLHEIRKLAEVTDNQSIIDVTNHLGSHDVDVESFDTDDVIKRKIPLPRVNTVMHKAINNVDDYFPKEISNVLAGDQFRAAIGGLFGKYVYIKNFPASVFRVNALSSWTPLSEDEKFIHNCSWRAWLALYFYRKGHIKLFEYYKNKNKHPQVLAIDYIKRNNIKSYYTNKFLEAIKKLDEINLDK